MVRGAEAAKQVRLGPDVDRLRLQLNLKEPVAYRSLRAVLRRVDGRQVWQTDRLPTKPTALGQAVRLSIPARALAAGDYELTLSGQSRVGTFEEISDYYFAVVKR
jgi:hypothetical protein